MNFFLGCSWPFAWLPRLETQGAVRRVKWMWFSAGYLTGTWIEKLDAIERLKCEGYEHDLA